MSLVVALALVGTCQRAHGQQQLSADMPSCSATHSTCKDAQGVSSSGECPVGGCKQCARDSASGVSTLGACKTRGGVKCTVSAKDGCTLNMLKGKGCDAECNSDAFAACVRMNSDNSFG